MRTTTALAAMAATAPLLLLPVTAAFAADAAGCTGSVQSLMADGSPLDTASAPGAGGTESDPLVIDPQGSVAWEGSTNAAITSGTWSVTVGGLPFLSGEVDNPDGDTSGSGTVDLAGAPAPAQWVLQSNARIPVAGQMSGPDGTCTGGGFIAGTGGSPISSPIFIAGAGLAVAGVLLGAGMLATTKATATTGAVGGAS